MEHLKGDSLAKALALPANIRLGCGYGQEPTLKEYPKSDSLAQDPALPANIRLGSVRLHLIIEVHKKVL